LKGKKSIGLWAAVSIGVGGMIGAGIFSILGTACQIGGNAVYISFILAGIVALFSTYSYAKLGVRYPSAGGPVEFLVRGFGDNVLSGGFNILMWIGYVFALALYARAFAAYALTFFPGASSIWLHVVATAIVLLFVLVNFVGARAVGQSELSIVTLKVGILVVFAAIGLAFVKPGLLSPEKFPPVPSILFAAAVVFLAYEGFGLITNAAEDMTAPERTLPRALYISVFLVIAIYVAVSLAVTGNLPLPEIVRAKDYALAEAAKPFLGMVGFKVIAVAALLSTSSAINATLYGGANVSYIIAKEGELPEFFERKIWGHGIEGLFITAGLVILFTNLFDLGGIAMMGSAAFLLIYAAVGVGHLKLYRKTGARPVFIWISVLSCLVSFVILSYYLVHHSPASLTMLGVVLVFSFAAEWLYRKKNPARSIKKRCPVED